MGGAILSAFFITGFIVGGISGFIVGAFFAAVATGSGFF